MLIDGRREVLEAIGQQCEAGVMALEDFEAGQTDSTWEKSGFHQEVDVGQNGRPRGPQMLV